MADPNQDLKDALLQAQRLLRPHIRVMQAAVVALDKQIHGLEVLLRSLEPSELRRVIANKLSDHIRRRRKLRDALSSLAGFTDAMAELEKDNYPRAIETSLSADQYAELEKIIADETSAFGTFTLEASGILLSLGQPANKPS